MPPLSRLRPVGGFVLLRVLINPAGQATDAKVLNAPNRELGESAQTAVRQWLFRPTLRDGRPVPVQTEVRVNFTLSL